MPYWVEALLQIGAVFAVVILLVFLLGLFLTWKESGFSLLYLTPAPRVSKADKEAWPAYIELKYRGTEYEFAWGVDIRLTKKYEPISMQSDTPAAEYKSGQYFRTKSGAKRFARGWVRDQRRKRLAKRYTA